MSVDANVVWESKGEDVVSHILKLKQKYEIGELHAIELYAGDGHTLSNKMAEHCISFVAYDIDPTKEAGFRKNVPNGEFRCKDSVDLVRGMCDGELGYFNMISADGPVCIYGNNYCEHFEVIKYVYKFIKGEEKVLCVFPVIVKPYDIDKPENFVWLKRREKFYGTKNQNLDLAQVPEIYDSIFKAQKLSIIDRRYICREFRNGLDWMYEFIYVLQRGEII